VIGIVVVSHSRALARAAVDLALQMVQEDQRPRVRVAAGLDDGSFGTDAAAVSEAVQAADTGAGVLVLLDLGSAVMSADMALELLDPSTADRVRISSAPLVEGLVAAVVTASSGADLDRVHREAGRGLDAKVEHLGDHAQRPSETHQAGDGLGPEAASRLILVDLPHGLHARPAARFVACVNDFPTATVLARNEDSASDWVDAASISAVTGLHAGRGHRMRLRAVGEQSEEALDALEQLARSGFGDRAPAQAAPGVAEGTAARSGTRTPAPGLDVAVGPVRRAGERAEPSAYRGSNDVATERGRLERAIDVVAADLDDLATTTRSSVGAAEADVFLAHQAWVRDPAITTPAFASVDAGEPAANAYARAGERAASDLGELEDAYLRERAADVRSVTDRVVGTLVALTAVGAGSAPSDVPEGVAHILLTPDLDPATAVTVDPERVSGIVTTRGGSTGHGVLVAQSRGIPILPGWPEAARLPTGTVVAFDARRRRLWVEPDPTVLDNIEELVTQRAEQQRRDRAAAHDPGQTADGTPVAVEANVATADDATRAVELGAQGAGLVRTELLFDGWTSAPTVHEQTRALTTLAEALQGRPMTVRTWDVGADKPLPFLGRRQEQNPFLGVRGLRSFSTEPSLLHDQLRAVCRVARTHPVRLMFPMVTTLAEVHWALERLDDAARDECGSRPDGLEVGVMVEVPAAALRARLLATDLDFVSIGTNDLTQYTLAAERGNAGVEHLFDPLDPAVLRLVHTVCRDVPDGVRVGVCGAAASDPAAGALLVGLGVRELSATPLAVPRVKAGLRHRSQTELSRLAERALACRAASEVRALLDAELG